MGDFTHDKTEPAGRQRPLRRGTAADSRAAFDVSWRAFVALEHRLGEADSPEISNAALDEDWRTYRSVYDHLLAHGDAFWVAEAPENRLAGYARSVRYGDVLELTEFFVDPSAQADGLGRGLLARAFPDDDPAPRRLILATSDPAALSLYLRWGLHQQAVSYPLTCKSPQDRPLDSDLAMSDATGDDETLGETLDEILGALAAIDGTLLGFERDLQHRWLLTQGDCLLFRRAERVVGYAYCTRHGQGPVAALEAGDLPAMLAALETRCAQQGKPLSLRLPLANRTAVGFALARGYRLGGFAVHVLSDFELPGLDRYAISSPPYFL